MTKNQPQLLKGFRDFLPVEKRTRDFVMGRIVEVFNRCGFDPIETPALEYRETIMGKYGDEADKLIYEFKDKGERDVALRYDQTVPTARVIANYRDRIAFPFRRYQTQNVFRADKPQKGRYREFTQCDIDIFGSTDPIADAEILACTYAAYKNIGFSNVILRVNDRAILMDTLQPFATKQVSVFSIIQSLDKLDKMSRDDVRGELENKGMEKERAAECMEAIFQVEPSEKLQEILRLAEELGVERESLEFCSTIARGLDYYTGMIFEVRIPGYEVGSTGGGGRYDNLIGTLSSIDVPAVGMAFGFDRTVEAALQLGVIQPSRRENGVLVTVFDASMVNASAMLVSKLRAQGITAQLYPKLDQLSKQFKYADKKGIDRVVVLGPDEEKKGTYCYSNLVNGPRDQQVTFEELVKIVIS